MESGSGAVKPKVCEGAADDGRRRLDVGSRLGMGWLAADVHGGPAAMGRPDHLLVLAIRYLGASNRPPERGAAIAPPSPEDTLAQRYAHGEIDDEEYRRRIALLREHQV